MLTNNFLKMLSDRQQEIIEATIKLISEKGIQGFTTKNLSAEIGISEPAIYRHFTGKTEILHTMLEQFQVSLSENLMQIVKSDFKAIEKINAILNQLLTRFTENPSYVTVIFSDEIYSNEKTLADKISEIMETMNKLFEYIISQGQENKEIRKDVQSQHIVLMIKGSIRLLVKKWKKNDCAFDLKKEASKLLSSIEELIKVN